MKRVGFPIALFAISSLVWLACGSSQPLPPPPISSPAPAVSAPMMTAAPMDQAPEEPVSGFVQPEVEPGEDGWEVYTSSVEVTPETAASMQPGSVSPEAAVIHFYAGLMLGDGSHEAVLVPERSERLEKKLARVVTWTFYVVRLESRKPSGDGTLWIKVFFDLEAPIPGREPDRDQGTDEVEVTEIDGQWYVSGVPT